MMYLRRLTSSDIPFARDDAHRLLPAMIGCLVGFAALLLVTALSLHRALDAQAADVTGVVQVEIPANATPITLEKVMTQLQRTAGVTHVATMERVDMQALLEPWLGGDFSMDHLPLPTILEVSTKVEETSMKVDLLALRKSLTAIDADIRVADRGPWVEQLAAALGMIQTLVLVAAALLLACVIGMVVLVARTNLKLHFKTVGLLHMFGATDDYILRQFQWNSAALAARGASAGVVVATLIFAVLVSLSMKLHSTVIPVIHVSVAHGVVLALLPVLTACTALFATRATVRSMLHQMH